MTSRRLWLVVALGLGGSVPVAAGPGGSLGGAGAPTPRSPPVSEAAPVASSPEVPPEAHPGPVPDPPVRRGETSNLPIPAAPSSGSGGKTLVCLILPLSGPHGGLGSRVLDRMEAALAAASLTPWEARDDRGTDPGVVEAASWARDRECGVWVGGIGDREALGLVREAREQGVPLVGLWSSPLVADDDRVIGVTPDRRAPMVVLARYLGDAGVRRVFLLAGPTAGDRERATALQQAASGFGAVVRVEASQDPRSSAAALAEAMAARRSGGGCEPEALVLSAEPDLAVRWKGFLEAEGLTQGRDRCPGPLLAGPPSWATPEALRRYGLALEGAVTAAWRDDEGLPVTDPLVSGIRLALAALLHRVRSPEGSGWNGLEVRLGDRLIRYLAGEWQGVEPAPLRLEGGRARWLDGTGDPPPEGQ